MLGWVTRGHSRTVVALSAAGAGRRRPGSPADHRPPSVAVSSTFTQPAGVFLGDDRGGLVERSRPCHVRRRRGRGRACYPTVMTIPHLARIVDVDVVHRRALARATPTTSSSLLVRAGRAAGDPDGQRRRLQRPRPDTLPDFRRRGRPGAARRGGPVTGIDYRPAAYGTVSQLPPPAPPVTGNTSLSAFDGLPVGADVVAVRLRRRRLGLHRVRSTFWRVDIVYETTPYPVGAPGLRVGTVQDVDVTLHGFTSTFPSDVDLLLVGPTGAAGHADVGRRRLARTRDRHRADLRRRGGHRACPTLTTHPLASGSYRPDQHRRRPRRLTSTRRRRPRRRERPACRSSTAPTPTAPGACSPSTTRSATSPASRAGGPWTSTGTTRQRPPGRSRWPAGAAYDDHVRGHAPGLGDRPGAEHRA